MLHSRSNADRYNWLTVEFEFHLGHSWRWKLLHRTILLWLSNPMAPKICIGPWILIWRQSTLGKPLLPDSSHCNCWYTLLMYAGTNRLSVTEKTYQHPWADINNISAHTVQYPLRPGYESVLNIQKWMDDSLSGTWDLGLRRLDALLKPCPWCMHLGT